MINISSMWHKCYSNENSGSLFFFIVLNTSNIQMKLNRWALAFPPHPLPNKFNLIQPVSHTHTHTCVGFDYYYLYLEYYGICG